MKKILGCFFILFTLIAFTGCEPCDDKAADCADAQGAAPVKTEKIIITPDNNRPVVVCDSQTFTAESVNGEELVWILDGEIVNRGTEYVYTVEAEEENNCKDGHGLISCGKASSSVRAHGLNNHLEIWHNFHKKYHRLIVVEACTLEAVRGWVLVDGDKRCQENSDGADSGTEPTAPVTPPPADEPAAPPTTEPTTPATKPTTPATTPTTPATKPTTPATTPTTPATKPTTPATKPTTPATTPTTPATKPTTPATTPTTPATKPTTPPATQSGLSISNLAGNYTLTAFTMTAQGTTVDQNSNLVGNWSGSMAITAAGDINVKFSTNGKTQTTSFKILKVEANRIQVKDAANNQTVWANIQVKGADLTISFPNGALAQGVSATLKFKKK